MIVGIGTDLVEIARIAASLDKLGLRFARRILAEAELQAFEESQQQAAFLAKRFAVKEATGKALGSGIGEGVNWAHIEVLHNELGAPQLALHAKALERAQALGARRWHVSISDEAGLAQAFVVLED